MDQGQSEKQHFFVDLQPIGRRADVTPDMTLLEAAQDAGVEIAAVCGGGGSCGKCRIQHMEGRLSPPSADERRFFRAAELEAGYRLACQAYPLSDVKINIPPESLSTPQRLQVEGQEVEIPLDPVVDVVGVALAPPTLHDLRADSVRLTDALAEQAIPRPYYGQPVLRTLSEELRALDWSGRVILRQRSPGEGPGCRQEVVGVVRRDERVVGLAVDIGTTKVAAYLVDLETGHTLAKDGVMNPQIAYGEDVVSRIAYANEHADGREVLQSRLIAGLNDLVARLSAEAGVVPEQIVDAVVVGNTAIHHLFVGLPVTQLGASPYIASVSEPLDIEAAYLGLKLAPGAKVYLPPNIAGYVGADHVSMLLATEAWQAKEPTVALDIGTNTEISLAVDGRLLSCSCASGPAFEGAHIHAGMRAAPGAVEYVQIGGSAGNDVRVQTIGNRPAVGICGSGILDIVAELRAASIIGRTGRFQQDHARIVPWQGGGAFRLVEQRRTGNGHDLLVTRQDVNEIQLAKGAIRAGVEVLLHEAGLTHEDLRAFIVAGAFGTYLDLKSATGIGMFPPLPLNRFKQVGNAAGTGARQMLISAARRRVAEAIVDRVNYIELTAHRDFTDIYMDAMVL